MSALSDSTTTTASPLLICSPSPLSQETILPSVMVEESAGMWISLTSARTATLRAAAARATRAGARARPLPANADFCCERTLAGAAALVMVAILEGVVERFPVGTREVTPPKIGARLRE